MKWSNMTFDIRTIAEKRYLSRRVYRGYAGWVLEIDLANMKISWEKLTSAVKDYFCGGRGFGLWMLWRSINSKSLKWNSPENVLCVSTGPLAGYGYPGSGKSTVTTISPLTGLAVDSNVGGHFASFLKLAGFDALGVTGKLNSGYGKTVIFIDGVKNQIKILEIGGLPVYSQELAEFLTDYFGEDEPRNISVISTGPGAKNALYGLLNFSFWDAGRQCVRHKQAGRGGTGTVMADKGVRAIVVRCNPKDKKMISANPQLLKELSRRHTSEIRKLDPKQNRMSVVGTTHLVEIMGAPEFQLLPVNNFQFGTHPDVHKLSADVFEEMFDKGYDGCHKGCPMACAHCIKKFVPKTGLFADHEVLVDGPEYETIAALGSNLGIFDARFVAEANFYCDAYGLDTISTGVSIAFAMECFERGLIDRVFTGGLDLRFGNSEAAMKLLHQFRYGIGFGKIAGQGVARMKEVFKKSFVYEPEQSRLLDDIAMHSKGLEFSLYITKESLAQQGGYGFALKGPQHDEAWLIFEDMVRGNLPEFEDKAEALWWFPLWRTWFGLMGLCKLPWNDVVPLDNKGNPQIPKHVEWYAEFYQAVTGRITSPDDLIKMSERVYSFHRLLNIFLSDESGCQDTIPYRAMGPVTVEEYESRETHYDMELYRRHSLRKIIAASTEEKIRLLRKHREEAFGRLRDAVYKRRGWTKAGIPTVLLE